jgi:YVTN family beta-propeller protein
VACRGIGNASPAWPGSLGRLLVFAGNVLIGGTLWSDATGLAADVSTRYEIKERWRFEGPGRWDTLTLDSSGKHLFIGRADHIAVVDTDSGNVVGFIRRADGVRGIALAEGSKRGYASNGNADSIVVFDLDRYKVVREAPVSGHGPKAVMYQPFTDRLFVFNEHSDDVTVFNAATLEIIKTIPLPGTPGPAVDSGDGFLFVHLHGNPGRGAVIDAQRLEVTAVWTLPDCTNPAGLAIDKVRQRLVSACAGNRIVVTSSETGKQVAQAALDGQPDDVVFDARRDVIAASSRSGSLSIIRAASDDRYRVEQMVPIQEGSRELAVDARSGRIYTGTALFPPIGFPPAQASDPHAMPIGDSFTVIVVGAH